MGSSIYGLYRSVVLALLFYSQLTTMMGIPLIYKQEAIYIVQNTTLICLAMNNNLEGFVLLNYGMR